MTHIEYEVCNNVLPKYQLIATLTAHFDTRRMPRTGWSSPPRWPPGRAACRRTDLVSCHVSCMSHLSQLNHHKLRAALRRYGNQPISYNFCVGNQILHLIYGGLTLV